MTFTRSRGEYFKWAAHDDVLHPAYLEETVALLDQNPDVVLAYTDVVLIDSNGTPFGEYRFEIKVDDASPGRRFAELILVNHRLHRATEIFGLMRSSALKQTTLQGCYARGDSILLARMALLGHFGRVNKPLFLSRDHPAQSMAQKPTASRLENMMRRHLGVGPIPPPEWWDSRLKGKIVWPEWKIAWEYFRSVGMADLPLGQRLAAYGWYGWWLIRHVPKLGRDVLFAIEKLLRRAKTDSSVTTAASNSGVAGSNS